MTPMNPKEFDLDEVDKEMFDTFWNVSTSIITCQAELNPAEEMKKVDDYITKWFQTKQPGFFEFYHALGVLLCCIDGDYRASKRRFEKFMIIVDRYSDTNLHFRNPTEAPNFKMEILVPPLVALPSVVSPLAMIAATAANWPIGPDLCHDFMGTLTRPKGGRWCCVPYFRLFSGEILIHFGPFNCVLYTAITWASLDAPAYALRDGHSMREEDPTKGFDPIARGYEGCGNNKEGVRYIPAGQRKSIAPQRKRKAEEEARPTPVSIPPSIQILSHSPPPLQLDMLIPNMPTVGHLPALNISLDGVLVTGTELEI